LVNRVSSRNTIMTKEIWIDDHISPIRDILGGSKDGREKLLRSYIYQRRNLNNRHFQKTLTVDQTVAKLLDSKWPQKVRDFDPERWRRIMEMIRRRSRKVIKNPAAPRLVLYPGFERFNGRVYRFEGKPVIGCAPDFPRCSGDNLKVLLAHEYAHYVRWEKTGVPSDNVPIYAMIYEEGWAVWMSSRILPELEMNRLFMSNLHGLIGMANPHGGYLSWCRRHFGEIIAESRKVLQSKKEADLGRLFQCRRLGNDTTPIRVGYYLGYRMIEMLLERMTPEGLLRERPTFRKVSGWLDEVEGCSY
jgi:hypothetical protein